MSCNLPYVSFTISELGTAFGVLFDVSSRRYDLCRRDMICDTPAAEPSKRLAGQLRGQDAIALFDGHSVT